MTTLVNVGATPVWLLSADEVRCLPPGANLFDVARVLDEADVGALVVGAAEAVLGIVSERDVARALAAGCDPATTAVIDVAHTAVWCDASATVAEVAEEMMEQYVRHVLLEIDGRLVGIISARDLLGAYASAEMAGN